MDGRDIVTAWKAFKEANPTSFDGAAHGIYLENRLQHAFIAGIAAAEKQPASEVNDQ